MKIPRPPTSPAAMHFATTPSKTRRKASLAPPSLAEPQSIVAIRYFILAPMRGCMPSFIMTLQVIPAPDQHPFRHLRQTNADGNALREPNPGECRVHRKAAPERRDCLGRQCLSLCP